jgi:hypothetical protein
VLPYEAYASPINLLCYINKLAYCFYLGVEENEGRLCKFCYPGSSTTHNG